MPSAKPDAAATSNPSTCMIVIPDPRLTGPVVCLYESGVEIDMLGITRVRDLIIYCGALIRHEAGGSHWSWSSRANQRAAIRASVECGGGNRCWPLVGPSSSFRLLIGRCSAVDYQVLLRGLQKDVAATEDDWGCGGYLLCSPVRKCAAGVLHTAGAASTYLQHRPHGWCQYEGYIETTHR